MQPNLVTPIRRALRDGVVGADAAEVESLMNTYVNNYLFRLEKQESLRKFELRVGVAPKLSYGNLEVQNVWSTETDHLYLDQKHELLDKIVALITAQMSEALALHILKIRLNVDNNDSFETTYEECGF